MKHKLFILSFDFYKEGYNKMPYSIASLIASVKKKCENLIDIDYELIDLDKFYFQYKSNQELIEKEVIKYVKKSIDEKCWDANFIAIGVSAWSEKYVKKILPFINSNFKGKIILGGYEITAIDENTLPVEYPLVNFFIKGYAETALSNILLGKYSLISKSLIINELLDPFSLISPYISLILPIEKKVYWETKRGCPYTCGFCEWGNASQKNIIFLPFDRLMEEIRLFKIQKVESINILDGTFNFGKKGEYNYVEILKQLAENTNAKINFQTRFEKISFDDEQSRRFLNICESYKQRITMEFGLQTIHKNEMEIIGRQNNIKHISSVMAYLNKKNINYELSIIYGIPGQTIESFLETIEFILKNGCERVCAYALRIPRNSKMEKEKEKLGVKEGFNVFNITYTKSSYSFSEEDYEVMSNFSDAIKGLHTVKSLTNIKYRLTYLIMEHQKDNSFKLVDITDKNRLYFNAPTERIKNIIFGYEEVILMLLASKEGQNLLRSILNILAQKQNLFSQFLSKVIKLFIENGVWHYQTEDGKKYICSLKISKQGNIYIFKDSMEMKERLFFLN